jgi:hypothetical protein
MSSEGSNPSQTAGRGRPRKWGSGADRKRAYRIRKAADMAEPTRLRVELREARGEIRRLERRAAQLERVIEQAERGAARELVHRNELESTIERRDDSIAFWKRRAETAERQAWHARHRDDSGRET